MSHVPPMGRARSRGVPFWLGVAIGWSLMAFAVRGILQHDIDTRPASLARFVIGSAAVHDLLVAPVVLGVGVLMARWRLGRGRRPWTLGRSRGRAAVQAGLIVTGLVAVYAFPLVRGYARALHNPTSLPRDYSTELAIVVAVIWGATLAGVLADVVVRRLRERGRKARP
ncbi:MAG: hypothetical protein QOJ19_3528 [Acidimicrobiia bacterium]|nr:hypothetical protein [Acidimicrobiia bacterium]